MRRLALITAATVTLLATSSAYSRPVSYAGGWTFIEKSDRQSSSTLLHYTPAHQWSIGTRLEQDRDGDFAMLSIHPTWLAKRWFGENYQGNLYFHGGAGVAKGTNGNPLADDTALYGGVIADWETRSVFVSYRSHYLDAGHFGTQFIQAARAGFAPYEGDTGDLHTWLMVEIDHRPENRKAVALTPLIRLFKGPVLFEAGYNLISNQPLINFTYRF